MIGRDARTAYSAGRDGTVVAWDLEGSRRLERPFAPEPGALRPRALSVAVRGAPIAVADADGRVELFDSRSLRRIGRIPLPGGRRGGVALSPDGGTLAAVTTDGALGFWAVRSGRRLGDLQPAGGGAANGLTFSPDGRWLTASGGGNLLRLWDARRRVSVGTLERSVADVSFSRDGTTLALTLREENFDGGLEILAVPSLERRQDRGRPARHGGALQPRRGRVRLRRSSGSRVDLRHADVATDGAPALPSTATSWRRTSAPTGGCWPRRRSTGRRGSGISRRGGPSAAPCPAARATWSARPSARTAARSSSRTTAAATSGTCGASPGTGTRATSPVAGSPARSGRTPCPGRDYAPAC